MINVHISPDFLDKRDTGDGGIRRVSEAMIKYLPEFGVEHVRNPHDANIIVNHGAMQTHVWGVPIVNINHGLYWSRYPWGEGYQDVNRQVVNAMCMAVAHTVPSEWVGRAVRRGGLFYPEVVYHGVDTEDFQVPVTHEGFVLWNKARADYVSNPTDLMTIAQRMPDVPFVSTLGHPLSNLRLCGVVDYPTMRTILAKAGVYLCTARETFGIGTLEAMACGVPVAGWNWGGQAEIILPGETGYLAAPGDYAGLADCIRKCLAERQRLSANCVEDVRTRWQWRPRIHQYAEIFKTVYKDFYETKRPKVSVIVTAYKLDQFLPACLDSVNRQTMSDFECLVIDDAQSDSTRQLVADYNHKDGRVRYIPTPHNFGLVGARNFGFGKAKGRYIRHLDADDYLAETALEIESIALDNDPTIHIAYGHLESVREDGTRVLEHGEPVRSDWPPEEFDWTEQMAHMNQLPSCVMMRREVLERSGGYRERMKRQEDADFWCRVTSLGFRARKVTQAVTYFHRQRQDSKGTLEWKEAGGEADWTAWFPWRVGATDLRTAVDILRKCNGIHPAPYLVPFSAQQTSRETAPWPINDYAYPAVSIIVTCGPSHKPYLTDALDSIWAQRYPDWECIVVNDTGKKWSKNILGAPWAKIVSTNGNKGAATARNEGFKFARGKLIVWMDADDYWLPWYLEMMAAYSEKNFGIIYSDLIADDGKQMKVYQYPDFSPENVAQHMSYPGSSVAIPRPIVEAVMNSQGGWDTRIPGMEDWDFQIAMHAAGFCAYRIPEPLFVYRMTTSTKRESDYAKIDQILAYLDEKWPQYRKGQEKMCGCSNPQPVNTQPRSMMGSSGVQMPSMVDTNANLPMVDLEYVGPQAEDFSIRSRIDASIMYRFGNNDEHRVRTVFTQDAAYFTGLMDGNGVPLYRLVQKVSMPMEHHPETIVGALAA